MVFCNKIKSRHHRLYRLVTILILIDGFLQYNNSDRMTTNVIGHNPYFNRWFSAIKDCYAKKSNSTCHNPYFNRWFSAIKEVFISLLMIVSHNPYFNRWFSAI